MGLERSGRNTSIVRVFETTLLDPTIITPTILVTPAFFPRTLTIPPYYLDSPNILDGLYPPSSIDRI